MSAPHPPPTNPFAAVVMNTMRSSREELWQGHCLAPGLRSVAEGAVAGVANSPLTTNTAAKDNSGSGDDATSMHVAAVLRGLRQSNIKGSNGLSSSTIRQIWASPAELPPSGITVVPAAVALASPRRGPPASAAKAAHAASLGGHGGGEGNRSGKGLSSPTAVSEEIAARHRFAAETGDVRWSARAAAPATVTVDLEGRPPHASHVNNHNNNSQRGGKGSNLGATAAAVLPASEHEDLLGMGDDDELRYPLLSGQGSLSRPVATAKTLALLSGGERGTTLLPARGKAAPALEAALHSTAITKVLPTGFNVTNDGRPVGSYNNGASANAFTPNATVVSSGLGSTFNAHTNNGTAKLSSSSSTGGHSYTQSLAATARATFLRREDEEGPTEDERLAKTTSQSSRRVNAAAAVGKSLDGGLLAALQASRMPSNTVSSNSSPRKAVSSPSLLSLRTCGAAADARRNGEQLPPSSPRQSGHSNAVRRPLPLPRETTVTTTPIAAATLHAGRAAEKAALLGAAAMHAASPSPSSSANLASVGSSDPTCKDSNHRSFSASGSPRPVMFAPRRVHSRGGSVPSLVTVLQTRLVAEAVGPAEAAARARLLAAEASQWAARISGPAAADLSLLVEQRGVRNAAFRIGQIRVEQQNAMAEAAAREEGAKRRQRGARLGKWEEEEEEEKQNFAVVAKNNSAAVSAAENDDVATVDAILREELRASRQFARPKRHSTDATSFVETNENDGEEEEKGSGINANEDQRGDGGSGDGTTALNFAGRQMLRLGSPRTVGGTSAPRKDSVGSAAAAVDGYGRVGGASDRVVDVLGGIDRSAEALRRLPATNPPIGGGAAPRGGRHRNAATLNRPLKDRIIQGSAAIPPPPPLLAGGGGAAVGGVVIHRSPDGRERIALLGDDDEVSQQAPHNNYQQEQQQTLNQNHSQPPQRGTHDTFEEHWNSPYPPCDLRQSTVRLSLGPNINVGGTQQRGAPPSSVAPFVNFKPMPPPRPLSGPGGASAVNANNTCGGASRRERLSVSFTADNHQQQGYGGTIIGGDGHTDPRFAMASGASSVGGDKTFRGWNALDAGGLSLRTSPPADDEVDSAVAQTPTRTVTGLPLTSAPTFLSAKRDEGLPPPSPRPVTLKERPRVRGLAAVPAHIISPRKETRGVVGAGVVGGEEKASQSLLASYATARSAPPLASSSSGPFAPLSVGAKALDTKGGRLPAYIPSA